MNPHTKGPWHAGELPVDDDREVPAVFIWDEDETTFIASVCDEDNNGKATQANALLIAAAPDLLAACKDALEQITVLVVGKVADPILLRLMDVIAKAEGSAE